MTAPRLLRCQVVSVTESTALIAWAADRYLLASLHYSSEKGEGIVHLKERANLGRFHISSLAPATTYTFRVLASGKTLTVGQFNTLPAPAGERLWRFAIIADPHYSLSREDRKGRLFAESDTLLRETVARGTSMGAELLLMPGDLTELGLSDEVNGCYGVLAGFPGKIVAVLGDHDCGSKSTQDGSTLLTMLGLDSAYAHPARGNFGLHYFAIPWRDFTLIGLDSSASALGPQQQAWLKNTLERSPGQVIIISHRALHPNPAIRDDDQAVMDWQDVSPLLAGARRTVVVYVGHKNVPQRLILM